MSKKGTALWREAHLEVKCVKNWRVRSSFGSWDVEKVHAVVVRSTFRSQNVQSTPFSEVEMLKKCTPLWREAHFHVKMCKAHHVRTTFGGSDVEKVYAVVARSTFRSQNVKNTRGSDHFWRFRCRFASLHYITLHYTTLHYTTRHYTPLHYITLHYTSFQYTSLHYTTLHYITLDYDYNYNYNYNYTTTLHYNTLHYTTLNYTTLRYTTLHYTTLHYTTLHYLALHFTTLHHSTSNITTTTQLHSTTLQYITLHYITLHYTTLRYITLNDAAQQIDR